MTEEAIVSAAFGTTTPTAAWREHGGAIRPRCRCRSGSVASSVGGDLIPFLIAFVVLR
jgi:hypothetical protein